jgi:dihydrodipicolinate synthase/N-acetylneuraminate lyase
MYLHVILISFLLHLGALLGGNVAALKSFMPLVGLDLGPPREPMRALTDDEKKQFHKEIEDLGFFSWKAAVTS